GQPWRVAIEVPDASDDHALALPLRDRSIATSGDYRRHAGNGDERYAHTIDPRTGLPVRNNLASVTVLHPGCMQADALATALTVLGEEEGLAYARRHELAALFILRERDAWRVVATPAFQALAAIS
ncbi:FAD:protein FMN transferase, partial [Achromobacter insolitus]|uniref:FAD:protein FMN transferase n=1 Tax=Achromobacter insolitus TaxID=217204 RepID=UPI002FDEBF35